MSVTTAMNARPPRVDLTSPGAMTLARDEFERHVDATTVRAVAAFLDEVVVLALDAATSSSSALVAASRPNRPFTFGSVAAAWRTVVESVVEAIVPRVPALVAASPTYGHLLDQRVSRGPIAVLAYDRAMAALQASAATGATAVERETALRAALDMQAPAHDPLLPEGTAPAVNWQAQAQRVARTESTAAFSRWSIEEARAQGFTTKTWVPHHDHLVRPTHAEAGGQVVPLDQTFLVGGWAILYPGDPYAPDGERMNCRCVLRMGR